MRRVAWFESAKGRVFPAVIDTDGRVYGFLDEETATWAANCDLNLKENFNPRNKTDLIEIDPNDTWGN